MVSHLLSLAFFAGLLLHANATIFWAIPHEKIARPLTADIPCNAESTATVEIDIPSLAASLGVDRLDSVIISMKVNAAAASTSPTKPKILQAMIDQGHSNLLFTKTSEKTLEADSPHLPQIVTQHATSPHAGEADAQILISHFAQHDRLILAVPVKLSCRAQAGTMEARIVDARARAPGGAFISVPAEIFPQSKLEMSVSSLPAASEAVAQAAPAPWTPVGPVEAPAAASFGAVPAAAPQAHPAAAPKAYPAAAPQAALAAAHTYAYAPVSSAPTYNFEAEPMAEAEDIDPIERPYMQLGRFVTRMAEKASTATRAVLEAGAPNKRAEAKASSQPRRAISDVGFTCPCAPAQVPAAGRMCLTGAEAGGEADALVVCNVADCSEEELGYECVASGAATKTCSIKAKQELALVFVKYDVMDKTAMCMYRENVINEVTAL